MMDNLNGAIDKYWDSSKQVKSLIKKVAKTRNQEATDKLVNLGWTLDELQVVIEMFFS